MYTHSLLLDLTRLLLHYQLDGGFALLEGALGFRHPCLIDHILTLPHEDRIDLLSDECLVFFDQLSYH